MLLGMKEDNPDKEKMQTFDKAWSLMEIIGVGMVEMKVWKWLYANPEATPAQLKTQTISAATEVWNKYFAPVLGVRDSPILAIYSHMVEVPLYLPNYSYGQIIEFQIEEYLKNKDFPAEIDRMYSQGNLTPQQWMKGAVGEKISAQPILNALDGSTNPLNLQLIFTPCPLKGALKQIKTPLGVMEGELQADRRRKKS